jgi:hypothetical protein
VHKPFTMKILSAKLREVLGNPAPAWTRFCPKVGGCVRRNTQPEIFWHRTALQVFAKSLKTKI